MVTILTHPGKSLFVQDDLPDWWERICNGAVCYCNNRYLEIIINSKKKMTTLPIFLGTVATGLGSEEVE